jgi:hypothetical protein
MNTEIKFVYPEVFVGEKFKYKIFDRKDISLVDMKGETHYFEDATQVTMEVVDFFPGEKNEYKLRFIKDRETKFYKWYFESEILDAIYGNFIFNVR